MVKLNEKQREKIDQGGWIYASSITEVQGNDKEHVKKSLKNLIEKLEDERNIQLVEANYSDVEAIEDGLFVYSVELHYLVKDFNELTKVALLFSPSFMEIHEPKQIKIPVGDAQNILIDISNIVTQLSQAIFIQGTKIKQLEETKNKK